MLQEMERRQKEQVERLKRDLKSAAAEDDAPKSRKREMRELDLKILREVGSDAVLQNIRLERDLFVTAWSGSESAINATWGKVTTWRVFLHTSSRCPSQAHNDSVPDCASLGSGCAPSLHSGREQECGRAPGSTAAKA
jgi:hypothetical protein